ncbi:unnamed protein product [Amoebophrya sp. A120]|nr:unnamed protein product [Amoebophrya sp. A120]|eukprot:GSA120T00008160001.1
MPQYSGPFASHQLQGGGSMPSTSSSTSASRLRQPAPVSAAGTTTAYTTSTASSTTRGVLLSACANLEEEFIVFTRELDALLNRRSTISKQILIRVRAWRERLMYVNANSAFERLRNLYLGLLFYCLSADDWKHPPVNKMPKEQAGPVPGLPPDVVCMLRHRIGPALLRETCAVLDTEERTYRAKVVNGNVKSMQRMNHSAMMVHQGHFGGGGVVVDGVIQNLFEDDPAAVQAATISGTSCASNKAAAKKDGFSVHQLRDVVAAAAEGGQGILEQSGDVLAQQYHEHQRPNATLPLSRKQSISPPRRGGGTDRDVGVGMTAISIIPDQSALVEPSAEFENTLVDQDRALETAAAAEQGGPEQTKSPAGRAEPSAGQHPRCRENNSVSPMPRRASSEVVGQSGPVRPDSTEDLVSSDPGQQVQPGNDQEQQKNAAQASSQPGVLVFYPDDHQHQLIPDTVTNRLRQKQVHQQPPFRTGPFTPTSRRVSISTVPAVNEVFVSPGRTTSRPRTGSGGINLQIRSRNASNSPTLEEHQRQRLIRQDSLQYTGVGAPAARLPINATTASIGGSAAVIYRGRSGSRPAVLVSSGNAVRNNNSQLNSQGRVRGSPKEKEHVILHHYHHHDNMRIQNLEKQVRILTAENKRLRTQVRQGQVREERLRNAMSLREKAYVDAPDGEPLRDNSAVLAYVMQSPRRDDLELLDDNNFHNYSASRPVGANRTNSSRSPLEAQPLPASQQERKQLIQNPPVASLSKSMLLDDQAFLAELDRKLQADVPYNAFSSTTHSKSTASNGAPAEEFLHYLDEFQFQTKSLLDRKDSSKRINSASPPKSSLVGKFTGGSSPPGHLQLKDGTVVGVAGSGAASGDVDNFSSRELVDLIDRSLTS